MAQVTRPAHDKIAAYVFSAQVARKTRKSTQIYAYNPIRYPPPSGDMRVYVAVNGDVYVIFVLRDPVSGLPILNEVITDAAFAVVAYTNALGGGVVAIPSAHYSSAGLGNGYYSLHILNADVPLLTGTAGQLTMRVQTQHAICEDINIWVGPTDTTIAADITAAVTAINNNTDTEVAASTTTLAADIAAIGGGGGEAIPLQSIAKVIITIPTIADVYAGTRIRITCLITLEGLPHSLATLSLTTKDPSSAEVIYAIHDMVLASPGVYYRELVATTVGTWGFLFSSTDPGLESFEQGTFKVLAITL